MRVANLEVDQYLLRERIADAGMDVVWRADQRAFARQVAEHLGPTELEALPEVLTRVRRTSRAATIDVGSDSPPLVVMAKVEGTTLARELFRGERIPLARALELTTQMLRALAVAHGVGVVHADLRPEHVVITASPVGEVVNLVDRGDPRDREWVSASAYLAPEILAGGRPTIASDLYAVGVMLYELLTGEPPFHGGSMLDVLHRQLHGTIVPPSLHHADRMIPADVERAVLRALARKPDARFPDAATFAVELEAARRKLARGTTPPPMPVVKLAASPDNVERQIERLRGAVAAAIDHGAASAIVDRSLDLALALATYGRDKDAHAALEAAKEYVMWDDHLEDRDLPRLVQRLQRAQERLREPAAVAS